MYKVYDVECEECGKIQEQWIDSSDDKLFFDDCEDCGGKTKRIFSKFSFKLLYDNKKDTVGWSFNNYERSRYWDDVKKEREKGKDVIPYNEK